MSALREITSVAQFNEIVASLQPSTLLVLFFHAPWASPCQQLRDFLSRHSSQYQETSPVCFLSINAEDMYEISERYEVAAVPFLALVKDSKVLETISGADTVKAEETIERYAALPQSSNNSSANTTAVPPALDADSTKENVPPPAIPPETNSDAAADAQKPRDSGEEELFGRLRALVKAAPVMLFMKGTPSGPQCGFSRQMVGLLREKSVKYGFFNILADEDVRQGLKKLADWPTYPQLWINGELVGGLDIVSLGLPFSRPPGQCVILTRFSILQIKEELGSDPDFLKPYSVAQKA